MSVSHSDPEPAGETIDWEALRWRELEWGALPHTTRKGTIPYLTVREAGRLDCAMTNREARPHLVKSYKGMQSPAFNGYVYVYAYESKECKELQWVRKRGIDLRGFTLSYDGDVRSGYVLWRLMGGSSEDDLNLDVAKYYATRGKLTHLDEVYGEYNSHTALIKACEKGYLEIVKCLLAAGADKDKANSYGWTPLIRAAGGGHVEIVRLLLSAGADKDKADNNGMTPLIWAANGGHVMTVRLLLAAGANKNKVTSGGITALSFTTSGGHQEIVQLLQPASPQT